VKKLFAFLMALCLVCGVMLLAGCDGVPGAEVAAGGNGIWKNAFTESDLNNVTLNMEVTFDDDRHVSLEYKMFSDKILSNDGDIFDAEAIATARHVYMDMIQAVIDNQGKFQLDNSKNCYTTDQAITFNTEALVYTAKVTMSDVAVTLNNNGKLACITFHMVQDISGDGQTYSLVLDGIFTFSDYGTTKAD
jgi:hypothetical protein